jgi:enamine deaminase RidA (YjgF/YER057c/UK114 family)
MADPSRPADKTVKQLGVPWEKTYGYAQAVQVKDVIYVSGQLSHDDQGNLVGPAPTDASGRIVDEVIYVTDLDAAFAVAGAVRKAAYGTDAPACASTIAGITRLAFPQQLVEISFTAVLPG